jgi:hypothetical protein
LDTRCFIGVDVVVAGIDELSAAVPRTDIIDVKNPISSMDGINSIHTSICSIFFIEDQLRSNIIKNLC